MNHIYLGWVIIRKGGKCDSALNPDTNNPLNPYIYLIVLVFNHRRNRRKKERKIIPLIPSSLFDLFIGQYLIIVIL